MKTDDQPIAALATVSGEAGVAVLRMAGSGVFEVADRLVCTRGSPPSARPAGSFFHAVIRNPATGERVDDALVLIFRGPRSYTGEDAVEIQGHGGVVPSRRLLEAALRAGARLAAPGEFTRRAFLNGRLDLTQAEAVADLIRARTDRAAAAAREQLDGALGRQINSLYESVTIVCSSIETMLDFDEGDLPDDFILNQEELLAEILQVAVRMLDSWREGHWLRDGARVVIVGRANVGKSSLLNALLGRDRAIVTSHPGTTRDTLEEAWSLNGIPVILIDTAGLRETSCEIEQLGIDRTRNMLTRADVVLYVIDGALPAAKEDIEALHTLPEGRSLLVVNKSDLGTFGSTGLLPDSRIIPVAHVSALTGEGMDQLRHKLGDCLGVDDRSAGYAAHATISERHRCGLQEAVDALTQAQVHLKAGSAGLVLAARDLQRTAESLGLIIGRTYTDDLLDLIFSRFCVGK